MPDPNSEHQGLSQPEPDVSAGTVQSPILRLLESTRFELLPTKGAVEAARYLPPGSTVTVTASPRKSLDMTIAVAEALVAEGLRVVPHLSARMVEGPSHLAHICRRLAAHGLREAFVIGGDAPQPAGPYSSALDLLHALRETDHALTRIGIGAYPEGHPLIERSALLRALLAKQPYAEYMSTQICFDPLRIASWLDEVRQRGVMLPVYVGIPGSVERTKLLEISLRVGVGDSLRFLRKQGGTIAQLLRRRNYSPDALAKAVATIAGSGSAGSADGRILGFHVYTFNQVERTAGWYARMRPPPG